MIVEELECGYAHDAGPKKARRMTVAEAKRLRVGAEVLVVDLKGKWRRAKVNGRPQTWKRKYPGVRVPLKYGLYEYLDDDRRHGANGDPMGYLLVEAES